MNDQLDLQSYGLSHLKGRNLLFIGESDLTRLLDTVGREDRSFYLPIHLSPDNLFQLLTNSDCRRCGKCCVPNPLNPTHPGVEVFESELKPIARSLGVSPKKLRSKTTKGKLIKDPSQPAEPKMTRRLVLPCPFFDSKLKQCRVYPVRPLVCKVYPVLTSKTLSHTEVKVNCDYGKDIVRNAIRTLREQRPGLKWLL